MDESQLYCVLVHQALLHILRGGCEITNQISIITFKTNVKKANFEIMTTATDLELNDLMFSVEVFLSPYPLQHILRKLVLALTVTIITAICQ